MNFYINKLTGAVTLGIQNNTTVDRIDAVRLNTKILQIFFHDGTTASALAPGSAGVLIVKKTNAPNDAAILSCGAWTPPVTTITGYVFALLVASAALSTALGNSESVALTLQIVWTENGQRGSTPPISFVVAQSYYQGTEDFPEPETPFPLPDEILTTAGNLAGIVDPDAARAHLGLATMGFIRRVAVPAAYDSDGAPGDFAIDTGNAALWSYAGDGETHNWLKFTGSNAA